MSNPSTDHDIGNILPPLDLPEITGYRLSRVVGNGGMSTVYLGEQVSLEREVAIKVMLPEALADEVSRRRFENEARTIARLEHPHIVGIFEIGRTRDGLPYYAMPFLAHGHLGQRTFDDDIGPVRVRAILHALLAALDYAHARGVVHRDVKAENVLFDEAERPLLADFGIALRRFGPRVTTAGMAVGSTAYMAPEQARGEEVDARADLYSVGVLAWEMLTGRLPFMAGDALSMAVMHAQDPIPKLPRHLRHWQRFLDKALTKSPSARFRSAQHMREALDRVPRRSGQPFTQALTESRRLVDSIRRWPKTAWIGVVLVIAATTGLALRQGDSGSENFFRAPTAIDANGVASNGLPVPGAMPGVPVIGDQDNAMLRPLPGSSAEGMVVAAEQALRAHNLTAPAGNNAYDSVLAAWKTDPTHPRLATVTAALFDAFGVETEHRLRAGDDRRAIDYLHHASELAAQSRQGDGAAMQQLRVRAAKAIGARVAQAAAKLDRPAALRAIDSARAIGLDAATIAAFTTQVQRIPQAGDTLVDDGMRLMRLGDKLIAAAPRDVSRADYARFASATNRPPSLCRERSSLLRILAPRSWQAPGYPQSPQHAVVCVSSSDADAYARWLGQHTGRRYRLPNASESRALPDGGGAKPIAEWLSECGADCRQRMSAGQSWRGAAGARPLDATRGYDDVGFRLVRDP